MDFQKLLFFILALTGLGGAVANGAHLLQHFYLWPLVRLAGFASLFIYALLMLRRRRYNTHSYEN